MATAANSSCAAQNSPRSRQSRRSLISLSGSVDQEQFLTSSSTTSSSDTFPSKEGSTPTCLGEDADAVQLDNIENCGAAKKPAWNKPSNEPIADVGVVMGADSWPALSESARASPKSSSAYSLKAGSINVSQEMAVGSLSSLKEVSTSISTPNSTSNHVALARQRSMKRGGGSSSQSSTPTNDSVSQAPPAQGTMAEAPPSNPGKSSGSAGESSRDNTYRDVGQRGGSYGGNESQPQRSSFRRSNSGPQSRGDGSYHHGHGGRRDQERGRQEWGNNPHRSFGNRESNAPQQRVGSRPFLRGPAPNAPFISPPPPPMRPFVTPIVYTEMSSPSVYYVPGPHPDPFRPMSMVPIPPMFFTMPDPQLSSKILNQIDYYFSNENLVKDTFLRRNMDSEGWVSIKLIASFKKVTQLTDNIQFISDAIQTSSVVEVQGDKVRRRGDWIKWIMSPVQTTVTSPHSTNKFTQNMLAAHLNTVTLDEKAAT